MTHMKIMSWNLQEGALLPSTVTGGVPGDDLSRLSAAQALVDAHAPDVLVINEALWCMPHDGHVVDYARRFGFPHAHAALYDGHWGNVILSRLPFVSRGWFNIHNRGGLLAHIDLPQGPIVVATYHPHPSRWPHHKAEDFLQVAGQCPPGAGLVLCGDFNAISPEDHPDHRALTAAFSRFSKRPGPDSARFIDSGQSIFPMLSAAGLRDAFLPGRRSHTMPTRLISTNEDGRMRIDHAWVNDHVLVQSAQVCHDPLADQASDHYPLVLELSFAP
jgi:endonuclease/exonuclease/phosphatase family metal-dependent hydrolase